MGRIPYIERKQPVHTINRVRKTHPKGWLSADQQFEILASCIKIGFKVTPLNYLTPEGACSCKKACGTPGKHPRYKGWPEKGIDTLKRLRVEFRKNRGFNWCCITGQISGIFVLDVDTKEDGPASLAEFEAKHGALPPTLTQTTGSGGKHYIFRYPADGRRIKNSVGKVGKGLDIRSDRGQIAIAPSIHKSGNRYQFDSPPGAVEIAEAPEWLLSLVCIVEEPVTPLTPEQIAEYNRQHVLLQKSGGTSAARRYVEAALKAEVANVLSAGEHQRNRTLNDAAYNLGKYIPSGLLSRDEVYNSLLQAALAIGLETFESDATILSGISGGQKKPKLPPERPIDHETRDEVDLTGVVATAVPAAGQGTQDDAATSPAPILRMSKAEQAEFDAIFGASLDRELELQKDPEAFAAYEAEQIALQGGAADRRIDSAHSRGTTPLRERLTAAQQVELDISIAKSSGKKPESFNATRPNTTPGKPETAAISITQPITQPYGRCEHCDPSRCHRPCHRCAVGKLGVMRPRPDSSPCTNGGRYLLESVARGEYGKLSEVCFKCGTWKCNKCGYDNECDHLSHYALFGSKLQDSLEQPCLQLPDYDIEVTAVKTVPVQHGCQKVIVSELSRRKYANKLTKLGVYYLADYIGNNQFAFYCFLPLGFDPWRLRYETVTKESTWGREVVAKQVIEPELITFTEFDFEHRNNLANAGRYVKLARSVWEICDMPEGSHMYFRAVTYCKALRMPKRMITTKRNKMRCRIRIDQEEVLAAVKEFKADMSQVDTRKIDRSYRRGLTQYLLKFWRFDFGDWAPPEKVEAFVNRLAGKDRIIEPTDEALFASTQETGSSCLSYPLVT